MNILQVTNLNEVFPIVLSTLTLILVSLYCFSDNKKIEVEVEKGPEISEITSTTSEFDEDRNDDDTSEDDQYTSILYKSFLLMTKKQLLKITGNKYRNVNKDELIIIAMNKFIIASIENYKLMPQDSKNFVKENKDIMKDEFFKLYNVKSKEFLDNITERNLDDSNSEESDSEESKELIFNS
jgi:hypothetical protein